LSLRAEKPVLRQHLDVPTSAKEALLERRHFGKKKDVVKPEEISSPIVVFNPVVCSFKAVN
jgi:hypothetical protein